MIPIEKVLPKEEWLQYQEDTNFQKFLSYIEDKLHSEEDIRIAVTYYMEQRSIQNTMLNAVDFGRILKRIQRPNNLDRLAEKAHPIPHSNGSVRLAMDTEMKITEISRDTKDINTILEQIMNEDMSNVEVSKEDQEDIQQMLQQGIQKVIDTVNEKKGGRFQQILRDHDIQAKSFAYGAACISLGWIILLILLIQKM